MRLNLFSHSADQYTNYLDDSQRNGVGLTYQTEFNSFKQLFRNMFSSRKIRQENRRLEEESMLNSDKTVIDIEASSEENPIKKETQTDRKRKTIFDTLSSRGK